mmetsp:Transcript_44355/g.131385  ORF Transcript_44355/g.131385 Transcript_44355/m.131385 type:complete len:205 (-) Transcript_44355:800-1414(-)
MRARASSMTPPRTPAVFWERSVGWVGMNWGVMSAPVEASMTRTFSGSSVISQWWPVPQSSSRDLGTSSSRSARISAARGRSRSSIRSLTCSLSETGRPRIARATSMPRDCTRGSPISRSDRSTSFFCDSSSCSMSSSTARSCARRWSSELTLRKASRVMTRTIASSEGANASRPTDMMLFAATSMTSGLRRRLRAGQRKLPAGA